MTDPWPELKRQIQAAEGMDRLEWVRAAHRYVEEETMGRNSDDISWAAFHDSGSVMHGGRGKVARGSQAGRRGQGKQSPAQVRKIKAQVKAQRKAAAKARGKK